MKAAQGLQQILRRIQKMFNLGLETGLNSTRNHGIMNNRNPIHQMRSECRRPAAAPGWTISITSAYSPRLLTFPIFDRMCRRWGLSMQAWLILPGDFRGSCDRAGSLRG